MVVALDCKWAVEKVSNSNPSKITTMIFLRRALSILVILVGSIGANGCFMMFIPAAQTLQKSFRTSADEEFLSTMRRLIQESVEALALNLQTRSHVELGKIDVAGDLITLELFRRAIQEALIKSDLLKTDTKAEPAPGSNANHQKEFPRLDAQLYRIRDELWMTQQLIHLPSGKTIWTGIHSESLPIAKGKQKPISK